VFALHLIDCSGRTGSGKSSIISRFALGKFLYENDLSYEEQYTKFISVDGLVSQLKVGEYVEETNSARYRDILIRRGHAFLLVCDCESVPAAKELAKLHEIVRRVKDDDEAEMKVPVVIAYNKSDLVTDQSPATVTIEQVHEMNEWINKCKIEVVSTSAKDNINVEALFHKLVRLVRKDRMEKYKKTVLQLEQKHKSNKQCNVQ